MEFGEVAERLNASVSKTEILARVSGVQIPPSPLVIPLASYSLQGFCLILKILDELFLVDAVLLLALRTIKNYLFADNSLIIALPIDSPIK